MRHLRRASLIVEAVICFGPATFLWFLSLIGLPFVLIAFVSGGWNCGVFLAQNALGGAGLFGAGALIVALNNPKRSISRVKLNVCFGCGVLASILSLALYDLPDRYVWAVFTLPILANFHFLYLASQSRK